MNLLLLLALAVPLSCLAFLSLLALLGVMTLGGVIHVVGTIRARRLQWPLGAKLQVPYKRESTRAYFADLGHSLQVPHNDAWSYRLISN